MNSAHLPVSEPAVPGRIEFDLFTPGELSGTPVGPDWVWAGYLAGGEVTLLTGPWKCGKTRWCRS